MAEDIEALVHLEQTFYDAGYQDGFAHGRIHGLIQGRALGREKGFEVWEEIGFYQGFAEMWKTILGVRPADAHLSRRAVHHIDQLLDLIRRFPTVNPSAVQHAEEEMDMARLQSQIRSRYKAVCASLGVRPTLRAGASHEHDDDGAREGPRGRARRDVWALDVDAKRPSGGLSF